MSNVPRIIVFDGLCRLCNASLRFVDRHDRTNKFRYVPFQSDVGAEVCAHFGLDVNDLDSFILLDGGRVYTKSAAWTQTLRLLPLPWSLAGSLLGILPRRVRDFGYDTVGKNRFRWFGRFEQCLWPPPEDPNVASPDEVSAALEMPNH